MALEKTLESPLNCKEIKPILKEINPEYSLEGLILKLKLLYFDHPTWRADTLERTLNLGKTEGRRRRGWQRMRWLDGTTNSMDRSWSKTPGENEGQGSLLCHSSRGRKETGNDLATEQQNQREELSWEDNITLSLSFQSSLLIFSLRFENPVTQERVKV